MMKRSYRSFTFRNSVHQFLDTFTDNLKIVKSHILATKTPDRIDIHEHGSNPPAAEVANPQRGRPQGSKDQIPRQRRTPGLPETIPPQESELMAISSPLLETPKELNPAEIEL